MLTKTLSEAKKKQRNILIKAMNNDIGSIDSAKDSWNPAQISERAKDISYIRRLVDTWNPAQLNEALKMLDLPVIDTWNPAQIEEQRRNLVFYLAERTLTGNPITLNILGNLTPEVTGLKVTMNPIQDLHGYPNPWAGGSGKNKLQNTASSQTIVNVNLTVNDDGSVTFDGEANSSYNAQYIGYFTLPNGSYIFTDGATNNNYYFYLLKEGDATWYKNGDTFTVDGNTRTRIILYIANNAVCDSTLYPMIRLSTVTDPTFAPYSNICPISGRTEASVTRTAGEDEETKTHQYSETIYGGVDDFVNGEGTVTYGIVDLGTLTWTKATTGQGNDYYIASDTPSNLKKASSASTAPNFLCDTFKTSTQARINEDTPMVTEQATASQPRILVAVNGYADATAFKTAMSGVQLCYELATPTTISTSAEEITLLKGENVLSTDGDSIELKYKQNF